MRWSILTTNIYEAAQIGVLGIILYMLVNTIAIYVLSRMLNEKNMQILFPFSFCKYEKTGTITFATTILEAAIFPWLLTNFLMEKMIGKVV